MDRTDEYAIRKHIDKKLLIAVAREAVQTAEDAREIAVKKMDDVRLANERQDSADAQAKAQGETADAMRRKEQAESDALKAQAATAQARSDTTTAREAKRQAEGDAATAQAARAQADADSTNAQAAKACAVRDYLVQQGVATGAVSSRGFGNSSPVSTNDNSTGRQQTAAWNWSSPAKRSVPQ